MNRLKSSDHYILVMAEPALAEKHVTHPKSYAARDMVIYIAIGLALVGVAFAIAVWRG